MLKKMKRQSALALVCYLIIFSISVEASQLVVWAKREGTKVHVEAQTDSGQPASQALLRITDKTGAVVRTGQLDPDGMLDFEIKENCSLDIDVRLDENRSGSFSLLSGSNN